MPGMPPVPGADSFSAQQINNIPMNAPMTQAAPAAPAPAAPVSPAVSSEELNALKNQIMEHVHNETVNCYRNTEAALQGITEQLNKQKTGGTGGDNGTAVKLMVIAIIMIILDFLVNVAVLIKLFNLI